MLYLALVLILLVTGVRALMGRGLALTLFRTFHGAAAQPIGGLLVLISLVLAAWLVADPALMGLLWNGAGR